HRHLDAIDVCNRREPSPVWMPGKSIGRCKAGRFRRAWCKAFERTRDALECAVRTGGLHGYPLARGGRRRGLANAFGHGMRSGLLHPYRGAGKPARSPCSWVESAGFCGQTSVAIGPLPAIVRADFVGRSTVATPARCARTKSTLDCKHKGPRDVRDARFCPSEPHVRRRQYVGAVAAVRSDLRHHVFFDPAAAAKAREGTPG